MENFQKYMGFGQDFAEPKCVADVAVWIFLALCVSQEPFTAWRIKQTLRCECIHFIKQQLYKAAHVDDVTTKRFGLRPSGVDRRFPMQFV